MAYFRARLALATAGFSGAADITALPSRATLIAYEFAQLYSSSAS